MPDPGSAKSPPINCPRCGHEFAADEVLRSLRPAEAAAVFAGGGGQRGSGDLGFTCATCHAKLSLKGRQAATLLIEKQTRDLYASITAALQGKAKLQ
jgi:DNA-directed RNA polymerase subunit RPC12/RpoP